MTGNGDAQRLEKLEVQLRGAAPPPAQAEATYDLAERVSDTAKAMRDLANYSNAVAGDLERIVAMYIANMGRLLGKIETK